MSNLFFQKRNRTFKDRVDDLGYTLGEHKFKFSLAALALAFGAAAAPGYLHSHKAQADTKLALDAADQPHLVVETSGVIRTGTVYLGHAQKLDQDNPQDNLALLNHDPASCMSVTMRVTGGAENLPLTTRFSGNSSVSAVHFTDPSYDNGKYVCLAQHAATLDPEAGQEMEGTEDGENSTLQSGNDAQGRIIPAPRFNALNLV